MEENKKKKSWPIILATIILMTIFGGVIAIYLTGSIRFVNPEMNYLAMFVVFLTPLGCFFLLFLVGKRTIRICCLIILTPIALLSALLFLGTLLEFWIKGPYVWKCIRHIDLGQQQIRVYRYNAGATTSYSIEVRKEKPILPGLIYVECLYDEWGASDVRFEKFKDICFGVDNQALTEDEFLAIYKAETDDNYTWLEIAKYEEKSGNYEAALESYDKAIGNGRWWPPYVDKARCIRRHEGYEAAADWIEKLFEGLPKERKYYYILSRLNFTEGKIKEAIAALEKSVAVVCAKHGFRFDEEHFLIMDENTKAKEDIDFVSLMPTLEEIGQEYLRQKYYDEAWKYATMGVSVGQQLNRCKGYYNSSEIEAGSVECRIFRTYVLMQRKQLDEAEKEIDWAKILADRSSSLAYQDTIERARKVLADMKKKQIKQ